MKTEKKIGHPPQCGTKKVEPPIKSKPKKLYIKNVRRRTKGLIADQYHILTVKEMLQKLKKLGICGERKNNKVKQIQKTPKNMAC